MKKSLYLNSLVRLMFALTVAFGVIMPSQHIANADEESAALQKFKEPVATAMVRKLDKLDVTSPMAALLPVFDRGHVAIVMDDQKFLGLITRIDLLNYLRRRVA